MLANGFDWREKEQVKDDCEDVHKDGGRDESFDGPKSAGRYQ